VRAEIVFHGHDDSGCAVANAHAAVEAGARLVDTSVLGLGERNGITPLGALMARLYASDPALVAGYDLTCIPRLDRLVAGIAGVEVPFNTVVSGAHAFAHAAGAHTAAVLREPRTYEALDPAAFGVARTLHVGHHLTGRHALAHRAAALGLALDDRALGRATAAVKEAAGTRPLAADDLDDILLAIGREPSAVGS
jgi:homocitrate synthase